MPLATGFVIFPGGYKRSMRTALAAAAVLLCAAPLAASASPCTTQALAVPNTANLNFTLLHRTHNQATFSVAFDTHTAAPVPFPTSGLAVKLLVDGRVFRQVMFALSTKASFVAVYPPLRGTHELAAQLTSGERIMQTRTRCLVFR